MSTEPAARRLEAALSDCAAEIETALDSLVAAAEGPRGRVVDAMRYAALSGGKRLRPALLLLCGKAVGQIKQEHLTLAAVVELIHTATLVHDDVLDEAETRRHLATVNSRWDNKASVLLGDYLFTHSFYLASTTDSSSA